MTYFKKLFGYLFEFFKRGEDRSQKLKRNIAWSTIIKVGQMILELIKVPILLDYLDPEKYGVWLTIVSMVLWTQQFDFGLGAGLRFKLTESFALSSRTHIQKLISTAYVSMCISMSLLFIILAPIVSSFDWNIILNIRSIKHTELIKTILSVFFVFIVQFILNIISTILKADQRAAISDVFKPIGTALSLILILSLKFFSSNSLLLASLAMAVPYIFVLLIANVYYFKNDYYEYRPQVKMFEIVLLKDIYSLGLKFFLSQLAALIVFSSSNILISNLIDPQEVTIYNIARTYFSLMVIFFTIILIPFAAATTDAYVRKDYKWLKNSMKKLNQVSIIFSFAMLFMLIISPYTIDFWIGGVVIVPMKLGMALTVYYILSVFVSPYANFLGAVGKLNIQVYISIFKIIVFIPAAILMINKYGTIGLVATIIVINTLINLLFGYIQYKMIMNKNAKGIWNK